MSDELVNDPRPLLPQGRWFKVVVVVIALAVGMVLLVRQRSPDASSPPTPTASVPVSSNSTVTGAAGASTRRLTSGLFIVGRTPDHTAVYENRADARVRTLVLRSTTHGSIGHRSAIISYPLPPTAGPPPAIESTEGAYLDVPLGSGTARVHADLPGTELARIGRALRIVDGRPVVGRLRGLVVAADGIYGGCNLLETWYRSEDLGLDATLGAGYVYTVLTDCGGYEDALLAAGARPGPAVYVQPSAVSTVLGGNATISWEVPTGLVGVVGYRGEPPTARRIAALTTIAKGVRTYGSDVWQATHPFVQRTDALAAWTRWFSEPARPGPRPTREHRSRRPSRRHRRPGTGRSHARTSGRG